MTLDKGPTLFLHDVPLRGPNPLLHNVFLADNITAQVCNFVCMSSVCLSVGYHFSTNLHILLIYVEAILINIYNNVKKKLSQILLGHIHLLMKTHFCYCNQKMLLKNKYSLNEMFRMMEKSKLYIFIALNISVTCPTVYKTAEPRI